MQVNLISTLILKSSTFPPHLGELILDALCEESFFVSHIDHLSPTALILNGSVWHQGGFEEIYKTILIITPSPKVVFPRIVKSIWSRELADPGLAFLARKAMVIE